MSFALPQFASICDSFSHFDVKPPKIQVLCPQHKKISPMPMIYGKSDQKQVHSKFHKTLLHKGHKYVSQIAAVGAATDDNLKRINRSSLKLIKSLDFDAYMCDSSGIKPLSEMLRKIRMPIKDIKLVIRRVGRLNESDILSPNLRRRKGMKRFKIEFSGEVQVNGKGIRIFAKGLSKCFTLTSLEVQLSYLLDFGESDCNTVAQAIRKFPKLEHLKYFVHVFDAVSEENLKGPSSNSLSASCFRNLKTVAFRSFVKTGWTLMMDAQTEFHVKLIKSLPEQMNPTDFTFIFHNMTVPTEVFQEFTVAFPHLENLRKVFLEFAYCKLDPLDLFVFAGGIKNCTQIKQLTFKYNEARILFAECLCQFIKAIAKLDFLENIDLFFRKLTCAQEERSKMAQFLSAIENIEFVLAKESLHVFRRFEK